MLRRSSFAAVCGVAKASSPAFCVISKTAVPSLTECCISSPYCFRSVPSPANGGDGLLSRRLTQKRSVFNPAIRSPTCADEILDRLKVMDIAGERIRLDGVVPPTRKGDGVTLCDAKKLLKLAQLEVLKSRLRGIQRNRISYDEFLRICVEGASSKDLGLGFAKLLDESGTVIVLGDLVFLRPDQVMKAMEEVVESGENEKKRKELEKMEREKGVIDKRAEEMAKRELWCGLGLFVVQTLGLMRLTFWELSWDVMEPVCFFLTSSYFVAGYLFFLRTCTEPSFQGLLHARFLSKQRTLMLSSNFDLPRLHQLQKSLLGSRLDST